MRIALSLTIAVVLLVEGFANPFAYWNALPVAIALAGLARPAGRKNTPFAVFGAVVAGGQLGVHLAWHFDLGRLATGSSTGGLVFVFMPIYLTGFGGLAALAYALLEKRVAFPSQIVFWSAFATIATGLVALFALG